MKSVRKIIFTIVSIVIMSETIAEPVSTAAAPIIQKVQMVE